MQEISDVKKYNENTQYFQVSMIEFTQRTNRVMPENRQTSKMEAIEWLKDVNNFFKKINLDV